MSTIFRPPEMLIDAAVCADFFTAHEFFYDPDFLNQTECDSLVAALDETATQKLPTDGGGVYEAYTSPVHPLLVEAANFIASSIAQAAHRQLSADIPSLHEVLRYNDGTSLTMHRDVEGMARTKAIATLSGTCIFMADERPIRLSKGGLIIMRGRELRDVPTPFHGTRNNQERRILLAEPNYEN